MRRPDRAVLLIVDEQARAGFADLSEAHDYNQRRHGGTGLIQPLEWWPAGVWRYGIAAENAQVSQVTAMPERVYNELLRHARTSRRCVGAGYETTQGRWGLLRYHCPACGARID